MNIVKLIEGYPVEIITVNEEDNEKYFIAFLPDFGRSSCSGCGDTEEEAINSLRNVLKEVIEFFKETGKPIPKPNGKKI